MWEAHKKKNGLEHATVWCQEPEEGTQGPTAYLIWSHMTHPLSLPKYTQALRVLRDSEALCPGHTRHLPSPKPLQLFLLSSAPAPPCIILHTSRRVQTCFLALHQAQGDSAFSIRTINLGLKDHCHSRGTGKVRHNYPTIHHDSILLIFEESCRGWSSYFTGLGVHRLKWLVQNVWT